MEYTNKNILLIEVTADEKYKLQYASKNFDRAMFDKAVTIDPTSNPNGTDKVGAYVDWIIKNKVYAMTHYEIREITERLAQFYKFKDKIPPQHRNITAQTPAQFLAMMEMADKEEMFISKADREAQERQKLEKESKVVFDDDRYIVKVPYTEFASQELGNGSEWCTAYRNEQCRWEWYDKHGTLYIVFDKKNKVEVTNEKTGQKNNVLNKWQLYKDDRDDPDKNEYMDIHDDSFNPFEEFSDDKKLMDWMEKEGITEYKKITDEEINDFAKAFCRSIDISVSNYESIKYAFESEVESLEDANIRDIAGHLDEFSNQLYGEYDECKDKLKDDYYVDFEVESNKETLARYITGYDMWDYVKERMEDEEIDWIYLYDNYKVLPDNLEYEMNIDEYDDISDDLLNKILEHLYHKEADGLAGFYDFMVDYFQNRRKNPMSDEEKEDLKERIEKVEAIEYKNSGHPELDLAIPVSKKEEGVDYTGLDYILN